VLRRVVGEILKRAAISATRKSRYAWISGHDGDPWPFGRVFSLVQAPSSSSASSLLLSSLELSDTKVYEPYIRALLGTDSHFCEVVLKLTGTYPLFAHNPSPVRSTQSITFPPHSDTGRRSGAGGGDAVGALQSLSTLHPPPFTLHPSPSTLHPTPYTLHLTPYTLTPPSHSGSGRRPSEGSGDAVGGRQARRCYRAGCEPSLYSGSEAGSYLRLTDSCITQLKAEGLSRTCNESKEAEEEQKVQ